MATMKERKEAVGYRKEGPKCSNCAFFSCETEQVLRWGHKYAKTRNLRCTEHGWATKANAWCYTHKFRR